MPVNIRRGVNISHWLSQSNARGQKRRDWFGRDDMMRLRELGLDHIRLPIDEEQMWTTAGAREAEAFDLMQSALDWAAAAEMRVIVDLHILRTHYFQDESPPLFTQPAEAERFAGLWADLSDALHTRPLDAVAYELMNEPAAPDPADWNRVAMYPFRAIRQREPQRTIVLGSNEGNQAKTFDQLDVPPDEHLILTFHHYHPMPLTHYRAGWTKHQETYAGPVHYPGPSLLPEDEALVPPADREHYAKVNKPYDRASIVADFAKPLAVRQRTGHPLYCGEFGCINRAPDEPRYRWYRDMVSVFDEFDIAWTAWDWRGQFAILDEHGQPTLALRGLLGT
ncbi:MAG TPA: cellulase family glycosylhydrolase [Tepidisphaeraceae bacterium]|jgi:endoglucanase|nr:cellulase family glycosylhydrolase [Tepidisphaeraceae bacterium]